MYYVYVEVTYRSLCTANMYKWQNLLHYKVKNIYKVCPDIISPPKIKKIKFKIFYIKLI